MAIRKASGRRSSPATEKPQSTKLARGPIERLFGLFRPNAGPKPLVLLGAGASVRSGIPTSEQLVDRAAKWAYCEAHGLYQDDPNVVRSDWLRWLHDHAWYRQEGPVADNYSAVVEHLLQPRQARKDFFLRVIKPGVPASSGYNRLLRLVDEGFIDTILTTNFDTVFLDLCSSNNRPHHIDVIRTPADYTLLSTSPRYPQYVFLHGTVEHYTDRNMTTEVQALDVSIAQRLTPLLRDRPLIVIGYRGAEPSIMRHLFLNTVDTTERFRQGLYWCSRNGDDNAMHPLVGELNSAISTNFLIIGIEGFDELMELLSERCGSRPDVPTPTASKGRQSAEGLPFDMSPVPASLDEIDWARVQTVLVTYCKTMSSALPPHVGRPWLLEKMCEFDLASKDGDSVVVTTAGYLLFAKSPQQRIGAAGVTIRV